MSDEQMKRILVVDDSPKNLELLAVILELDYEVLEASDGVEAVEVATQELPDLILMDLSMPRLDGWGALKQLRQDERTQRIPVVAVTAHALKGDRESALKAGFDDYFTKPVMAPELLDLVEGFLEGDG
jgi:CheY-like chemotaxis protein